MSEKCCIFAHEIVQIMKKIFLFFAAALFCANMNAQTLNEGFEGETFPPEGWEVSNIDTYSGWSAGSISSNACAQVRGTYGAAVNGSYLITPQLKPANGEKLTFDARVNDYASKGQLRIEVSTLGTETASFLPIDTFYTKSGLAKSLWKSEWRTYEVDLSAYAGQRIYVAFHQYDDADRIYVDNVTGVTLAGSATCEAPVNVLASDVQAHSAVLSWDGTAASYQYLCLAEGEQPDWSAAQTTTQTSVTISGLFEVTPYVFCVRAYCSADEQSMITTKSFKTICTPENIPFVETFYHYTTGVAPACWTVASAMPQVYVGIKKNYDDEGNGTLVRGSEYLVAQGGGPKTAQVFAMPAVNAALNTLEVAFDYHVNVAGAAYGVPEIGYMTDPSDRNTFVSLQELPQVAVTDTHYVYSLADVPATTRFIAFRYSGGTSELGSLTMDNFVVAPIGHSDEYTPEEIIDDADIYVLDQSYGEAKISWYAYNCEAFAIGLFSADQQAMIGGIVVTTGECDRFANEDGVAFSEYEDPENHYYISTKWIVNIDENAIQKGAAWNSCVTNLGTQLAPINGLKPGNYQVQVYVYDQISESMGTHVGNVNFELTQKIVSNLQATVAEDKQTATITWDEPELANGERLYVSVRTGATVVYDNYATIDEATSPLTVAVEEGKTYTVTVQIINRDKDPQGAEVGVDFTVGVNAYLPQDLNAGVENGDVATFSWTAAAAADAYVIALYLEGEFYSTISVNGAMNKTTYMPEDGTWTWTVQAYEQGENGNFFPISEAVAGNAITVKVPDIPSGAIEVTPWEMEAAYYPVESDDPDYRKGKYIWFVRLLCGSNGSAYPTAAFIIYSDKDDAISGHYATKYNNIYMGEELTMMEVVSGSANVQRLTAVDAELTLGFEDYDQEYFDQGYRFGRYSGTFTMKVEGGTVYAGRFNDIFCDSYNAAYLLDPDNNSKYHVGMWGEEGYTPEPPIEGLENVVSRTEDGQKFIYNGHLFILRDGKIYNALGAEVR